MTTQTERTARADPLLAGLNAPQQEAVQTVNGPLLILAGSGVGKTCCLIHRIAYLIQRAYVDPSQILAITFTKKAAMEMRERAIKLIGGEEKKIDVWIRTFHATGAQILRRWHDFVGLGEHFSILDQDDSIALVKEVLDILKFSREALWPSMVAEEISTWKNLLVTPAEVLSNPDPLVQHLGKVYERYEKLLRERNSADFDDLLVKVLRLFRENEGILEKYQNLWRYVMVDEYQDTNFAQYVFIRLLTQGHRNIAVVGDDWQCLAAGTKIEMGDGTEKSIEEIVIGDEVATHYGNGVKKTSTVDQVANREASETVTLTMTSGRQLTSTPEHLHFGGFVDKLSPQAFFVYIMFKKDVGWRLGVSQIYTSGGQSRLGYMTRALQESADALWVVAAYPSSIDARIAETILSLRFQVPTVPFRVRQGGGIVGSREAIHAIFSAIDTETGARRLLEHFRLFESYPHHLPQTDPDRMRRIVHLILCHKSAMHHLELYGQDTSGRQALEEIGLPVFKTKNSWRVRISSTSWSNLWAQAEKIEKTLDNVVIECVARLGLPPGKAHNYRRTLPFMPAANIQPGMGVFRSDGCFEVVQKKEWRSEPCEVYDIDVKGTHNFIANGIVTHNSIYGFRNADITNILEFQTDYPEAKVFKLEQNYRSTPQIIAAAQKVLYNNTYYMEKKLWTENRSGEEVKVLYSGDNNDEATKIASLIRTALMQNHRTPPHTPDDFVILYRTNVQSRPFEDALRRYGLPYKVYGDVSFYERTEIKDLISYLKLIHNPDDTTALKRIINKPTRGLGPKKVQQIENFAALMGCSVLAWILWVRREDKIREHFSGKKECADVKAFGDVMYHFLQLANKRPDEVLLEILAHTEYEKRLPKDATRMDRLANIQELVLSARRYADETGSSSTVESYLEDLVLTTPTDGGEDKAMVSLMSIHKSKGLEYPVVFIAGVEENLLPHVNALGDLSQIEEERRLAFVGMTRAKERLVLSYCGQRETFKGTQMTRPSRFLKELGE